MGARDSFETLDATAQAALVRGGEVLPSELVEAAIQRIEDRNPRLNAIIHPLFEKARAAAAGGELADGPFKGVPFVVKDAVCHTAGDPYHLGTRFLKQLSWTEDADTELVRRFRACGFVFVGKSNTPEFALSTTTEPLAYGPSRNPWNLDRSTGGSSGGSAAAVAAGLVPVAHANDMGGSIRIPASACGLVGLKPSRARSTLAPDFGEFWGPLTHEHVLTRSVRDTAAVLDAIAGPATGDPYTAPPPKRPWASEVGVDPGKLRIGFRTALTPHRASANECVEAVNETALLLQQLGHELEAVRLEAFDDARFSRFAVLLMVAAARDVERWSDRIGRELTEADLEPMNWLLAERGRGLSAAQYVAALEDLQAYCRGLCAWWDEGWDLLLTPTCGNVPPKIGALSPEVPVAEQMAGMGEYAGFTAPFNATGQPAISLPLHRTEEGLPVGIQLVAPYGREDLLIQVASQLEAVQPWPLLAPC